MAQEPSPVTKIIVSEIMKQVAKYLTAQLGSGYAWIVGMVLKYGGQALLDLVQPLWVKIKRYFPQKEALKKLEEKQNDPNSSVEDRAKEYENVINS